MDKSSDPRRQRHQQPLQMKTREQVTGLQKTASVRLAGGPCGPGEGGKSEELETGFSQYRVTQYRVTDKM